MWGLDPGLKPIAWEQGHSLGELCPISKWQSQVTSPITARTQLDKHIKVMFTFS